jgi:16S rRNA (cytidine1402-2'-O)-methyltransferase
MTAGTLYIVATPIGNLDDASTRMINTLKAVDVIAAEDTRRTAILLNRFGVKGRVESFHEHNERSRTPELVEKLKSGQSVALVTDAGTPAISDPGYRLVRAAGEAGIKVAAVPGPSALAAALSVSGLPTDAFSFKGFLPPTSAKRKKALMELGNADDTVVVFESPNRIIDALEDIRSVLGETHVAIAREMTKVHEEVLRGTAGEVLEALKKRAEIKGEITLLFRTHCKKADMKDFSGEIKRLMDEGFSASETAKLAAKEFGVSKSEAYKEALKFKEG